MRRRRCRTRSSRRIARCAGSARTPRCARGSLAIVANEARNRRRAAGRRTAFELRLAEERRPGGAAPSPEAALLEHEQRARLLAAIDRLGHEHRQVVTCRHLLGLSEAETAAALGWRRGTVKSRLSRALDRLAADLGAKAPAHERSLAR